MSTSEPIKPRPPAERDEPCPRDLGGPGGLKCVLPYGHEVHWNGRGDVWTTAIDAIEEAAERRGWARAMEALRAQAKAERREAATYPSGSPGRSTCLSYAVGIERALRALTEEEQ